MASRRRRPFTVRVEYARPVTELAWYSAQVAFLDLVPHPSVHLARLQPVIERFGVTAPRRWATCSAPLERDVEEPALRPLDDVHLVVENDGHSHHLHPVMAKRISGVYQ